jgi:hypothetical protein
VLARPLIRSDAAVRGDAKLVRRGDSLELYGLADVPLEERPRVVASSDAPGALLAAIEAEDGRRAAPVAATAAPDVSQEELARIEEQMRTLGYL